MQKSPLLLAILGALSGCANTSETEACITWEPELACPARGDVSVEEMWMQNSCQAREKVTEVLSEGTHKDVGGFGSGDSCCYTVEVTEVDAQAHCPIAGRPYFESGASRRAPLAHRPSGSARAAAWASAGADEHASIAAFSRLALQLLAHGAPSDLLRAVHQAAMDEVAHAERCWALARHFGGSPVSAGAFPFTEPVAVNEPLAALAAATVRDGCLGETLGAHLARVAAELAIEPEVKAALDAIAAEESEHAVLAYRIVAWALRVGGDEVRAAVNAAFAAPWPRLDVEELALRANVAPELLRRAADAAVAEVLVPAQARLLAA